MMSPNTSVCYLSSPILQCTFEETTDSAGWNMTRLYERFELNTGSVVQLDYNCATPNYNSCIGLTLQKVTGAWAGKYRDIISFVFKCICSMKLTPLKESLKMTALCKSKHIR